jgi:uncharacterized iron-regulated membrane protein
MNGTGPVSDEPERLSDTEPVLAGDSRASRLWRSIWRTHFYAGLFAAPILVLLAITGLVILYTEPIERAVDGELVTVTERESAVSLDDQRAAVADEYPEWALVSVTPPKAPDRSTVFAMTDEDGSAVNVYVDPYTGEVLGRQTDGDDIVGLANRLHGNLDNEQVTVPVPSLAGIWGDGPLFADAAVGDMVVEVFAGWGLVLAFTGAYLWWPRKKGTGKALFVPRLNKPGRARWRDLHAVGGTVLAVMLVFFLTTGLPWSAVWGPSWSFAASKITPNDQTSFWEWEGPTSDVPRTGDLDRAGRRIPWATSRDEIPPSGGGGAHHGDEPTGDTATEAGPPADPVSLDLVATAAEKEGMRPGYTINLPVDVLDDPDDPVYGSYVVVNPWPTRMHDQGALYLDQFSGETLAHSTPESWGRLQWLTEFGIQNHMGTQYGLFTRVLMTATCLLVLWNVITAAVMGNKRRRSGTLGLPRRPVNVRIQRILGITALVLAVVYPLWGLTLVAVLLVDRYVIRRVPRLRYAFGMR